MREFTVLSVLFMISLAREFMFQDNQIATFYKYCSKKKKNLESEGFTINKEVNQFNFIITSQNRLNPKRRKAQAEDKWYQFVKKEKEYI